MWRASKAWVINDSGQGISKVLDLVGVQEVSWDKGGTVWAEDYKSYNYKTLNTAEKN
jgi:hypothetical protein